MISADHFRKIGVTHHFCQDFSSSAVSEDGKKAYAIISDGCSTAKESEIGAMLLVKTAEQCLYPVREWDGCNEMTNMVIHTANVSRRGMQMDIKSLAATLLTIAVKPDRFTVTVTGDGVIVARHKKLGLIWLDMSFSSGAPFYLRYNLSHADRETYIASYPGDYIIKTGTLDGIETVYLTKPVSPEDGMLTYSYDYPFTDYDLVGVMSDGARSFVKKEMNGTRATNEQVPLSEIVKEVFAFKGIKGEFVKRRCQFAFEAFQKRGWFNNDDFSIGVVANIEEGKNE